MKGRGRREKWIDRKMEKVVEGIRVVSTNEAIRCMLEKRRENTKWLEDSKKSPPSNKLESPGAKTRNGARPLPCV